MIAYRYPGVITELRNNNKIESPPITCATQGTKKNTAHNPLNNIRAHEQRQGGGRGRLDREIKKAPAEEKGNLSEDMVYTDFHARYLALRMDRAGSPGHPSPSPW